MRANKCTDSCVCASLSRKGLIAHSNNVTSSKRGDTLTCHTTMCRNPINCLYNSAHVTIWCVEVGPNAREGSKQEHNWAGVVWLPLRSLSEGRTVSGQNSHPKSSITWLHFAFPRQEYFLVCWIVTKLAPYMINTLWLKPPSHDKKSWSTLPCLPLLPPSSKIMACA